MSLFVMVRIGGTDEQPQLRPALIVQTWSADCVNAQLFLDGGNDDRYSAFSNREAGEAGEASCHLFGPIHAGNCKAGNPPRSSNTVWATSITKGDGIGQWRDRAYP